MGEYQPNQEERLQEEHIYPVSESIVLKLPKHFGFYKTIMIFKEQTAVKEPVIPDKKGATNQKRKMRCETDGYMVFRKKGRKIISFYIKEQKEHIELSYRMII